MWTKWMAAGTLLALVGCSGMKLPTVETEDYTATLCGEGAVLVPCQSLGVLSVPKGGDALVTVMVAIAGPYLAKQAQLKSCLMTTFPEAVEGGIVVTATAACMLNGVPVSEKLTLTLAPPGAPTV